MSSWEDIANEVVPAGGSPGGLATGAARVRQRAGAHAARLGESLGARRYLTLPTPPPYPCRDSIWRGAEFSNARGSYYAVKLPVSHFDEEAAALLERLEASVNRCGVSLLQGLTTGDLCFLDIETLGVSASYPLFLIGIMKVEAGELRVHLYLARSLEEEAAVLQALAPSLAGKTLVTFNGKSFDWPYVRNRAARHGVRLPEPLTHVDLLFACRRRWRSLLPNCRLQTLEMGVCGRGRQGDIPSSQIPARYQQYLSQADDVEAALILAPVLFHNAIDVLTMGELICHLAEKE